MTQLGTACSLLSRSGARPTRRSRIALNAANFFLADMTAVVTPFLGTFLAAHHWRYDAIGLAVAASGLGVFLMQTPAGVIVDRVAHRPALLASTSLAVGFGYAALPLLPGPPPALADLLLFVTGAATAFFAPSLGAISLGLVGHDGLSRTMGVNQSWNHAGNITAAIAALLLVGVGVHLVFYAVGLVSLVAAASVLLIRNDDLDERLASGRPDAPAPAAPRIRELLSDRRVATLFVAAALFHFANAPVMPLVALHVRQLQGTERQVALVVLVAQAVMIPVALAAGVLSGRVGRKPVLAVGFLVLPIRILLYSFARSPHALLALQSLDGIGAGIYGVATVVVCADLTRGRGAFNALSAIVSNAVAFGGVLGSVLAGLLVQHLGFPSAYRLFAGIAALAAAVFLLGVPETGAPRRVNAARSTPSGVRGALPA